MVKIKHVLLVIKQYWRPCVRLCQTWFPTPGSMWLINHLTDDREGWVGMLGGLPDGMSSIVHCLHDPVTHNSHSPKKLSLTALSSLIFCFLFFLQEMTSFPQETIFFKHGRYISNYQNIFKKCLTKQTLNQTAFILHNCQSKTAFPWSANWCGGSQEACEF